MNMTEQFFLKGNEERKFQTAERCNPVINYMLCGKITG